MPSPEVARGGVPAVVLVIMGLAMGCGKHGAPPVAPAREQATEAPTPPAPPQPPAAERGAGPREARIRDISFDDVKLPLEKGDPFTPEILPAAVKALERERVRIRGYILPSFQQRGIENFVLVRDNMECCFGPGALLHDCVVVRMQPGKTTDFSIRPVAVTGTFRLEELKGPDGRHLAIYAIDGERVE